MWEKRQSSTWCSGWQSSIPPHLDLLDSTLLTLYCKQYVSVYVTGVFPVLLKLNSLNNPNCACGSSQSDQKWAKLLTSYADMGIFGLRTGSVYRRLQKQCVSKRHQCGTHRGVFIYCCILQHMSFHLTLVYVWCQRCWYESSPSWVSVEVHLTPKGDQTAIFLSCLN